MKTSSEGLALIRTFEGCVLTAYKCPAGVWTIGYGHTRGVKPGDKITKAQAEAYLAKDVEPAEASIWGLLGPDLIQGQFDALVSFVFNLGWKAFVGSTLCKLIRAKAPDRDVCEQLLRWHRAAGKPLVGLMKRRVAEANLWMGREAYRVVMKNNQVQIVRV